MPINVICPNAGCQKRFTVPDNAAGKSATCTNCGTKIAIPAGDDDLDEPAPKKRSKSDFELDDDRDEPKGRKGGRKGRDDDDDRDDDDRGGRGRDRGRPKRRAGSGDSNFVLDLLLLRFAIAPIAVPVLVWAGSLYILVDGLWTSIDVFRFSFMAGLRMLGLTLLAPVVLRVTGETTLVFFRMNEALNEIKNNTKKDAPPPAA